MSAIQPSNQPQVPVSQTKKSVKVIDGSTSRMRSPLDPFSLIFWLFFIIVVPVVLVWMAYKPMAPSPQILLPTLNHDVTAYHVITSNDIEMKLIDTHTVTTVIMREKGDLIGHFTLTPISSGQPISRSQIGPAPDLGLITNTYAVAISTNSIVISVSILHAGDIVSLAAIPLSNRASPPIIVFDKVLVLDLKSVGSQTVVILAIPVDHWLDYLAKTRNATVVLARQIQ